MASKRSRFATTGGQRSAHPPSHHTAGRGDLVISFRRTDVNPQADVNIKISRDANGVHVTNTPTHPDTFSASIQQTGPAINEQVIITFKGKE
jgi:hypothetical protein